MIAEPARRGVHGDRLGQSVQRVLIGGDVVTRGLRGRYNWWLCAVFRARFVCPAPRPPSPSSFCPGLVRTSAVGQKERSQCRFSVRVGGVPCEVVGRGVDPSEVYPFRCRCLVAGTNRANSTCVLAVTASWSARVYAVARETHGRVCPLCYLLPVTCCLRYISSCPGITLPASNRTEANRMTFAFLEAFPPQLAW